MKNILFVASECVPFIKTGGLADVVGSLPKYFPKEYFDVRVVIPKYAGIKEQFRNQMQYVTNFYMDLNWRQQYVGIFEMEYEGINSTLSTTRSISEEALHMRACRGI